MNKSGGVLVEILKDALIKGIRLIVAEGPQGHHFEPNNLSDSEKQILEIQALIVMYDSLVAENQVQQESKQDGNNDKQYI